MFTNRHFKIFICLLTLCDFEYTNAQTKKRQIGTSVWVKEGTVYIDSTIAFIITYDKLKRKRSEWKLFPDSTGAFTDTSFVELDTANRLTFFSQSGNINIREFDSLGNIKVDSFYGKYFSHKVAYRSFYDTKGRVIIRKSYVNGKVNLITTIEYKKDTVIETIEKYLTIKTIRNKCNQITYHEELTKTEDFSYQESYVNEYDTTGNLIKYSKFNDNKLTKETTHYYTNGMETHQIEKFYVDSHYVITTFRYEFW